MKKLLSIILALVCFAAVFTPASAAKKDAPSGKPSYSYDGKLFVGKFGNGTFHYKILDMKYAELVDVSPDNYYIIPSEIDGYPVISLGDRMYTNQYNLYTAFNFADNDNEAEESRTPYDWIIPEGVKYIGDEVFAGRNDMNSIKIPDSVEYIGKDAFRDCDRIEEVSLSGIKSIGDRAFFNCRNLKNFQLSDTLTEIGDKAFWNCDIREFTAPQSLSKIGKDAFVGCSKLFAADFSKCPDITLGECSLGYEDNHFNRSVFPTIADTKRTDSYPKYKRDNFTVIATGNIAGNNARAYARKNGFAYSVKCNADLVNLIKQNKSLGSLGEAYAGEKLTVILPDDNWSVFEASDNVAAKRDGTIIACKKGTAKITLVNNTYHYVTASFEVKDNPSLKIEKNGKYKTAKSVTVKKGKSVQLRIFGKSPILRNEYTSSKLAKITSKKNSETVKIKGTAKGSSTVKVKINQCYTVKLKVKVI